MRSYRDGFRWMLRLETGEDLLGTLSEFAKRNEIRSAAVPLGIGQLRTATLGYWNGQEYEPREVAGATELASLSGSIAEAEGRPSIHLHATLGTRSFSTVSGHVLRGTVGLLAEVYVESFPGHPFGRPLDESLGLRTLDLDP